MLLQKAIAYLKELLGIWLAIKEQLERIETTMNALDQKIATLTADVQKQASVSQSAITLIVGFAQQLKDAIQAAKDAGATGAQLTSLDDLHASVTGSTDALSAAVVANTPSAETPEAPVDPPLTPPPPPPLG